MSSDLSGIGFAFFLGLYFCCLLWGSVWRICMVFYFWVSSMEAKIGGEAHHYFGIGTSDLRVVGGKRSVEWNLNDWKYFFWKIFSFDSILLTR